MTATIQVGATLIEETIPDGSNQFPDGGRYQIAVFAGPEPLKTEYYPSLPALVAGLPIETPLTISCVLVDKDNQPYGDTGTGDITIPPEPQPVTVYKVDGTVSLDLTVVSWQETR